MSAEPVPVSEVLPPALADERVDRVVALLADISRREATELIVGGFVTVNGSLPDKPSVRVASGDRVTIEGLRRREPLEADPGVVYTVVHADDDLIVVDKPAGLIVHPGAGVRAGTLVNGLLAAFPDLEAMAAEQPDRPGIVHRLDKGTSGLLVVVRNEAARASVVAQLAERTVTRLYRALVWGLVDGSEGLIDAPLGRSPREPTKQAVVADGREARTTYEVVKRLPRSGMTELICRLETGRTHQIRVHLEAIGHAVVGDDQYHRQAEIEPLDRPFLHAEALGFVHPRTGDDLRFDSPLPGELRAFRQQLYELDQEPR